MTSAIIYVWKVGIRHHYTALLVMPTFQTNMMADVTITSGNDGGAMAAFQTSMVADVATTSDIRHHRCMESGHPPSFPLVIVTSAIIYVWKVGIRHHYRFASI